MLKDLIIKVLSKLFKSWDKSESPRPVAPEVKKDIQSKLEQVKEIEKTKAKLQLRLKDASMKPYLKDALLNEFNDLNLQKAKLIEEAKKDAKNLNDTDLINSIANLL